MREPKSYEEQIAIIWDLDEEIPDPDGCGNCEDRECLMREMDNRKDRF